MLSEIIEGSSKTQEIEDTEKDLMLFLKPQSFRGAKSAEVQYMSHFEDMCILIKKHINADPKRLTKLEFIKHWNHVKEILKPRK